MKTNSMPLQIGNQNMSKQQKEKGGITPGSILFNKANKSIDKYMNEKIDKVYLNSCNNQNIPRNIVGFHLY